MRIAIFISFVLLSSAINSNMITGIEISLSLVGAILVTMDVVEFIRGFFKS